MPGKSNIEWCDKSWNPVHGCSKVSSGCANCYAERLSNRFGHTGKKWTKPNATENVTLHPERLDVPLRWKKPSRIFVNSMSDLFHELVPDEFIRRVWRVMRDARHHIFQVLTKRPERMAAWLEENVYIPAEYGDWSLSEMSGGIVPNVHLGTSVEDDRVRHRIDSLRKCDAAVRFLSLEPLLGPLEDLDLEVIDWVIVGGESGPGHRPVEANWVRNIRDQCSEESTAFFFKQWGGQTPKAGGRLLDGRTHDEFPSPRLGEHAGAAL